MMAGHLKALFEAGITERRLFGDLTGLDGIDVAAGAARAVAIFLAYYEA